MNTSPLLAVIVPVYKVEDYLRECIDSILSQSYTSLRVILVDDGSPDRSGEICEEYARQDPRVIVVHKENGGQSTARNRGLELAKDATYITFVDSDDYIEPDIYKAAISFLEEHQEVDIVGFGINELRTEGKVYCGESVGRLYSREEALREVTQGFSFKLGPSVWSKVFRQEAIGTIRFREGYVYEDNSFVLEVLHKIKSYYLLPIAGYNYRMGRDGSTTGVFSERMSYLFNNIEELMSRYTRDRDMLLHANTMAVNYLWMYWYQLYLEAPEKYQEITKTFLPYLKRARRRPYLNVAGGRMHAMKTWLFLHAPYLYTRLSLR
jgi:hypothetical protein